MKTRRRMFLLIQLMFGFLLLSSTTALAQSVWTHAAAACAIDEDSSSKHEFLGGRMRLKGTNTGTIVARCNVANPLDNGGNPGWQWASLEVVYADPDGRGLNNQVVATLYKVHNSNGGVSEAGKFDSNNFDTNNNLEPKRVLINHPFDFYSYAYYVEIQVKRSNSTDTPSVSIVRLRNTPIE